MGSRFATRKADPRARVPCKQSQRNRLFWMILTAKFGLRHDHPVGGIAVDRSAVAAHLAHQLPHRWLMAGHCKTSQGRPLASTSRSRKLSLSGVNQGIRDRMCKAASNKLSCGGRVDHDEVVAMLDCGDGLVEIDETRWPRCHPTPGAFRARAYRPELRWQFRDQDCTFEPKARRFLDVVGEGPLPAVEIDGGHALAGFSSTQRRYGIAIVVFPEPPLLVFRPR